MKKLFKVSSAGHMPVGSLKTGLVLLIGVIFGFTFWTATAAPPATPAPSPTPTPGPGHQPCIVCHTAKANPHEITIDCNALEQHLRNHPEDEAGPCRATPTPTPTPSPSPTPTPGRGHQKCVVCHNVQHNPHTITIDCHALQRHLDHGDYEGPCQITPVTNP
jgi:hypothetical protein